MLKEIDLYYSKKFAQYGETPHGVDWNSVESQMVRFHQLCKIIDPQYSTFSINDLGCGYGALLELLGTEYPASSYLGVDISKKMIVAAERLHANRDNVRFIVSSEPDQIADYGVASGIFNVRQGRNDSEWWDYITEMLDVLDRTSSLGFAFNCLTSYSDADKMHDYLYYANPCLLFDLCKRQYARQVALLHDYGLYEFTVLVRKS